MKKKTCQNGFYRVVELNNGQKALFPITNYDEIEYYQNKSLDRLVNIDNKLYKIPSSSKKRIKVKNDKKY